MVAIIEGFYCTCIRNCLVLMYTLIFPFQKLPFFCFIKVKIPFQKLFLELTWLIWQDPSIAMLILYTSISY